MPKEKIKDDLIPVMDSEEKVKHALVPVFSLDNLNPALLPELATFKEKQLKVVEDNPFIEITDAASRELAKKHRTARVSARTALQSQDKLISAKFNEAKTKAKTYITELIEITQPGEIEQQKEIDRDEAVLEAKRTEKARLEKERIDNIKAELDNYVLSWKDAFNLMTFETIENIGANFYESYTTYDTAILQEFETLFPEKVEELTQYHYEKTTALTSAEIARSTVVIGEWFVAWGGKLFSMVFENATETVKIFQEQQKLTFPIQEFQDDFNQKYKELESQLLAKEKSLTEAKIASDNAAKQKEKEDQEKEEIFEIRKNRLLELGMLYSDEHDTIYIDASEDFMILCDDIKEESALEFERTIVEAKEVIQEFQNKSLVPEVTETPLPEPSTTEEEVIKCDGYSTSENISSISPEMAKGIESEEKALELAQTTDFSAPENTTVNVCSPLLETPLTPEESFVAPTWDSIIEDFKDSGEKSYSAWLKNNYNVPTKIQ